MIKMGPRGAKLCSSLDGIFGCFLCCPWIAYKASIRLPAEQRRSTQQTASDNDFMTGSFRTKRAETETEVKQDVSSRSRLAHLLEIA